MMLTMTLSEDKDYGVISMNRIIVQFLSISCDMLITLSTIQERMQFVSHWLKDLEKLLNSTNCNIYPSKLEELILSGYTTGFFLPTKFL